LTSLANSLYPEKVHARSHTHAFLTVPFITRKAIDNKPYRGQRESKDRKASFNAWV